jgi:hypothetical protein
LILLGKFYIAQAVDAHLINSPEGRLVDVLTLAVDEDGHSLLVEGVNAGELGR